MTAAKNFFVTLMVSVWCSLLVGAHVFVVAAFARHGLLRWMLGPTLFVAGMLAFSGALLRYNLKGLARATIAPDEVQVERKCFPRGNGTVNHHGDIALAVWRPYQRRNMPLDYEVWGVGPWSLGLAAMRGNADGLLDRLTKREARAAGEALRRAGYLVDGLEDTA